MSSISVSREVYLRGKSASDSDIYPGTGAMSRAASVLNGEGYAEAVKWNFGKVAKMWCCNLGKMAESSVFFLGKAAGLG